MPDRKDGESKDDFLSRCMGDDKMKREYPDNDQRYAVCNSYAEEAVEARMEDYIFIDRGNAEEKSREIGFDGDVYSTETADGSTLWFPGPNEEAFLEWYRENDAGDELDATAAEYKGRKVTLNKPFRTPKESKKFGVYTKNEKGNVVLVRFGDPKMEIKRDDPKRRKAFRDRHNCSDPGPKWKARYWSCKMWSKRSVTDLTSSEQQVYETGADSESVGCGCGCSGDKALAEEVRRDTFDNEQEARERAEELGCNSIHSHEEDGARVYMPCRTHEEYTEKTQESQPVESYTDGDTCPAGEEMRDGRCRPIAVTLEIDLTSVETSVVAEDGKSVITIKGVAFHDGFNKNGWEISADLAEYVAKSMIQSDITLNHPSVKNGRFSRNMDGGVDEAVVGVITDAYVHYKEGNTFEVGFTGDIVREELFASLESGLWLREGYGVSIGGTGIPDDTIEAENGRMMFTFATNFDFDHLAIVHKPAYPDAKITSVERKEVEISATVKYDCDSSIEHPKGELITMSEEITHTEVVEDNSAEMEALIAEKIMLEAQVAEYENEKAAKAEAERTGLVEEATSLGMKGHDDLSADTLRGLIASWNEAHPVVEEEEVVMEPVGASVEDEPVAPSTPVEETDVVANFLNQERMETPVDVYSKAYNTWVSAWNRTLTPAESQFRAKSYEQIRSDN